MINVVGWTQLVHMLRSMAVNGHSYYTGREGGIVVPIFKRLGDDVVNRAEFSGRCWSFPQFPAILLTCIPRRLNVHQL